MRRLAGALGDNGTLPPPPDYNAVLVEMNRTPQGHSELPEPSFTQPAARISTMTAADVAHILRSSMRHRAQQNRHTECLVEGTVPVHHDMAVHPSGPEFNPKPEAESTSLTWNAYYQCWCDLPMHCPHPLFIPHACCTVWGNSPN
jgi:hypothetical protein